MPSAERHWPQAREGGERGSPESEDLPPAVETIEPLAEGRIRVQARPHFVLAALLVAVVGRPARPQRRRRPEADRLAVGDGNRVAVRDRRRPAGDRRRRPVRLPEEAPRRPSSPASRPNVEAIAGYKPDLVIVAYDPNSLVATLRKLGIRVLVQDAARDLNEAYNQILALGRVTGQASSRRPTSSHDEEADQRFVARRRRAREG